MRVLRDAIVSGHFRPGQKLVEATLCAELGISRPSVREALRELAAEKLLNASPHKSFSVPQLSLSEAQGLYELRALLEGQIAALAAQLRSAKELETLRIATTRCRRAFTGHRASDLVATQADFYEALGCSCRHVELGDMARKLRFRTALQDREMASRKDLMAPVVKGLADVCDAVTALDVDRARAATQSLAKSRWHAVSRLTFPVSTGCATPFTRKPDAAALLHERRSDACYPGRQT